MKGCRVRDSFIGFVSSVLLLTACTTASASGVNSPAAASGPTATGDAGVEAPRSGSSLGAAPADTASTLEVSGSAEVDVVPDRARVTFAVETEAETAEEASQDNAAAMDSVLSALRGADVEGIEIETHGYTLQPRYRRPEQQGTTEIDGYRARNMVEVVVPETGAAGELIDVAIAAGANRVASLSFFASDVEEARLEALRDAIGRARREAEAIAGAMGVSLGPPLHVQGGADPPRPFMDMRAEMAQAGASTPVEPGTQTVSASVTVRYRLNVDEP